MARTPDRSGDPLSGPALPLERPRAPTEAEWARMSGRERDAVEGRLLASESQEELDEREAMSEGDHHRAAKDTALGTLRSYYDRIGRSIYVGVDITVFYPGEKGFTPDLIAIRDVPAGPRDCWMVSREGRGVELALEVHSRGSWRKDFVDNVEKYARMGILEYFIFDVHRRHLVGYRLAAGERRYESLRPALGRLSSQVLGLDLIVEEGALRFYHGTAALLDLGQMLARERARVDEEHARAEEEHARVATAVAALRRGIALSLSSRGVPLDDDARARLDETDDPALLGRWFERALTAGVAADLFRDG